MKLLILFLVTAAAHASTCANKLLLLSPTEAVTAYLTDLVDQQTLTAEHLTRVANGQSPITEKEAAVNSDLQIHREGLSDLLAINGVNLEVVKRWARQQLDEKERVHVKREETREKTKNDIYTKIEFHPLPPGKFRMGPPSESVEVELTHPFEMMSTHVTQKMWVDLMGANPTLLNRRTENLERPVTDVTWMAAAAFANKLSEKMGLKPVYDFSRVVFDKGTKADDGTWRNKSGEPRVDAPGEDVYQTSGFRLPTAAELEYVRRNLGLSQGHYTFDIAYENLESYFWLDTGLHDVGTTPRSLSINGKIFHDLAGNADSYTNDRAGPLKDGKNPQGPVGVEADGVSSLSKRVSYCRGFRFNPESLYCYSHFDVGQGFSNIVQSFRLVRTLPEVKK